MENRESLAALLREIGEDIDFEHETALVDDGLIDSLMISVIIAAIDTEFGVHIRVADIGPENMNSLEAMLNLIAQYQAKA